MLYSAFPSRMSKFDLCSACLAYTVPGFAQTNLDMCEHICKQDLFGVRTRNSNMAETHGV